MTFSMEQLRKSLKGSVVAIVTPMKEQLDKAVDLEALKRFVKWQLANETKGIVIMGTTGENPTVTDEEYEATVSTVVAEVAGRVPVLAGTGSNSTNTAIRRTKLVQKLGADGALIVTPYYNRPTQAGLVAHYTEIAQCSPTFPIILYNVPARTGCDLLPATVAELSRTVPNIIGTKEASGLLERYAELRSICAEGFLVISGDDDIAVDAILEGSADGVISVTGNVSPLAVSRTTDMALLARSGNKAVKAVEMAEGVTINGVKNVSVDQVRRMAAALQPLHTSLFLETNPAPVKWLTANCIDAAARIPGGMRLPMLPLSAIHHDPLRSIFEKAESQWKIEAFSK